MKKTIFTGCATALITPFTQDGKNVDIKGFEELLEFQKENHADAFVVAGTTGESPVLTANEKQSLFSAAVNFSNGKIPVIAGTGSNNTEEAVRKSNAAEKEGVDGLLIVTPYYNKCTQEGIVKHYAYIADRVSTPIIVYDVPSRTGVSVAPETYKALAEHKNISAIKEADPDMSKFLKTVELCGSSLDYYSGNDDLTPSMMNAGAKGVISVASNIIPDRIHEMCKCLSEGENEKGNGIFYSVLRLMNLLFCEVNPIPVKFAYSLLSGGTVSDAVRLPLTELSEKNKERIIEELTKLNSV